MHAATLAFRGLQYLRSPLSSESFMAYVLFWCISYITVKFHLNAFSSFCVKVEQTSILINFHIYYNAIVGKLAPHTRLGPSELYDYLLKVKCILGKLIGYYYTANYTLNKIVI